MAIDPLTATILATPTVLKGLDFLFDISGEQAAGEREEERQERQLEISEEEQRLREQERRFQRLMGVTQLGSNVLQNTTSAARLNALRNSGNSGNI